MKSFNDYLEAIQEGKNFKGIKANEFKNVTNRNIEISLEGDKELKDVKNWMSFDDFIEKILKPTDEIVTKSFKDIIERNFKKNPGPMTYPYRTKFGSKIWIRQL